MNNNTIVVYSSKYGHTEEYAKWISEGLGCEAACLKNVKAADLEKYTTVIFGGSIYASKMQFADFLKKHWDTLKAKNIVCFTVSLANPCADEYFTELEKQNFDSPQIDKIKFFNFHGGIDYSKLGFMHKSMMKMLVSMLRKKSDNQRSEMDKQIIDSFGKTVDFRDKASIRPLLDYVQLVQ